MQGTLTFGLELQAEVLAYQEDMLRKLSSSNATLRTFNAFSASVFTTVSRDFAQHGKTLKALRKELDALYRRIHALKLNMERMGPK